MDELEAVVSIHARHYWRASPSSADDRTRQTVFQSTPAITGERADDLVAVAVREMSFNPRPPLLASEPGRRVDPVPRPGVSIHARHYWRASPLASDAPALVFAFQSTPAITGERAASADCLVIILVGFNPRPPLLASEPFARPSMSPPTTVSIHARHYWRASLAGAG